MAKKKLKLIDVPEYPKLIARWIEDTDGADISKLAQVTGLSRTTVHNIVHEKIDPRLSTIQLIADAINGWG